MNALLLLHETTPAATSTAEDRLGFSFPALSRLAVTPLCRGDINRRSKSRDDKRRARACGKDDCYRCWVTCQPALG